MITPSLSSELETAVNDETGLCVGEILPLLASQFMCNRLSFLSLKNTLDPSPENRFPFRCGALHPQGDVNRTRGITDVPNEPQIEISYGVPTGL